MKKLSKGQIEKRKRIKDYLLKSLHIVSYILSVLFIIVCIVVGVQSCNGKKQVNKGLRNNLSDVQLRASVEQGLEFKNIYYLRQSGSNVHVSVEQQQSILNYYGVTDFNCYDNQSGNVGDTRSVFTTFDSCYYYNYNNDSFERISYLYCNYVLSIESSSSAVKRWRLASISFYSNDWRYVEKNSVYWSDNNYTILSVLHGINTALYFTDAEQSNPILDVFYYKTSAQEYLMPNKLNYYYWITDAYSGGRYIHESTAQGLDIAHHSSFVNSLQSINVDIDVPYFISNGKLFNCIRLNYTCLGYSGGYFVDTNQDSMYGYISFNASQLSNWGIFGGMAYINKDTYGSLVDQTIVLLREKVVLPGINNTSPVTCWSSSFNWLVDDYRKLTFLSQLSDYPGSLTSLELLTSLSITADTTNVYTSLFNLLSYAFSSLKGIFDIQVMPMLSIGVLIFAPLLIGIVVVIFRMVKK